MFREPRSYRSSFRPEPLVCRKINAGIADYGFTPDDIRSIEREIAFKLIPRLRQT